MTAPGKNNASVVCGVLCAFPVLITLLFPGDVPWINDEPRLIYTAFASNLHHTLPASGLTGSMGIPYGPLPLWIYKFLLWCSKDLILIVLLKITLTLTVTLAALYFMLRTLNWPLYFLLVPLASPYMVFYARLLWDNCFLIPVSAVLLLGLVKFIDTRRFSWILVSLGSIFVLIHTHLMSLLIIIPFFIYLALFERKWLTEHWKKAAVAMAVFLVLMVPYAVIILTRSVPGVRIPTAVSGYNWMDPVKFFSFWGFDTYLIPEMLSKDFTLPQGAYVFLKYLSGFSFVFFIVGFVQMSVILWKKAVERTALNVTEKFLSFGMITVILTILWFSLTGIGAYPHYSNAVCFVYLLFICFGLDRCRENRIVRAAFGLYLCSMLLLLTALSFYIHASGGTRGIHYGPTLQNQIDIVRKMNAFSPKSPASVSVDNLKFFPQSMGALQAIYGTPDGIRKDFPARMLRVVYKYSDRSGWIVLDSLGGPSK